MLHPSLNIINNTANTPLQQQSRQHSLTAEQQLHLLLEQQRQQGRDAETAYVQFLGAQASERGTESTTTSTTVCLEELLKLSPKSVVPALIESRKFELLDQWIARQLAQGSHLIAIGEAAYTTNQSFEGRNRRPSERIALGVCIHEYLTSSSAAKYCLSSNSNSNNNEPFLFLQVALKQNDWSISEICNEVHPNIQQKLLSILIELDNQPWEDLRSELERTLFSCNSGSTSTTISTLNMPMLSSFLADVGPQCTRNVTTLADTIAQCCNFNESQAAELIIFMITQALNNTTWGMEDDLAKSLLSSISRDNSSGANQSQWDVQTVAKFLTSQKKRLDWLNVANHLSISSFPPLKSKEQCQTLFDLFPVDFPREVLFERTWENADGQLSIFQHMLELTSSVNKGVTININLNQDEIETRAVAHSPSMPSVGVQCWSNTSFFARLLHLTETHQRQVNDIFVLGLLNFSEIVMCTLVRLKSTPIPLSDAAKKLQNDLYMEVLKKFFVYKPETMSNLSRYQAAYARVWAISPQGLAASICEGYRSNPCYVQAKFSAIVLNFAPNQKSREIVLNSGDTECSLQIGLVAADLGILDLSSWIKNHFDVSNKPNMKIQARYLFFLLRQLNLALQSNEIAARNNDAKAVTGPMVSLENASNIVSALQSNISPELQRQLIHDPENFGGNAGEGIPAQNAITSLLTALFSKYPVLDNKTKESNRDEVEEIANSYFSRIYTSEQSITEVIAMLKQFKSSGNQRENDIFACMITNLFDEYRFFAKYPEKELRITGILFGQLIQHELVTSITLGIALRYVLEALRKSPGPGTAASGGGSQGKMFRFGMFALEQFKTRLHEWPQYCSHIVQIPHLKDHYADLVTEIEATKKENDAIISSRKKGSATSTGLAPNNEPKPSPPVEKKAVFGPNLGRAVNCIKTENDDSLRMPPETLLDEVTRLINNLSPANCEAKATELKTLLGSSQEYFEWLAQYLVQKRISTQPNFHSLYLQFIDYLGDWGSTLVAAILASVYINIGRYLRSSKITTSTSERSLLKNLGSWLGNITLARNKPIFQVQLDCKELLFQGYETGMLIAVTPFVAKIMEGAKHSIVFKPPNPWVMGLLKIFKALYSIPDLKMNIKFEVEVLCKNLSVRLEDIDSSSTLIDLKRRISPVKLRNPDFNLKAVNAAKQQQQPPTESTTSTKETKQQPVSSTTSMSIPSTSTTPNPPQQPSSLTATAIPNLSQYVKINANIPIPDAKTIVPLALDRAIREVITPVIDRSVTIGCITTKELVSKDFSYESDEAKLRKASHLMVSNLAGSLALVTCREPLRTALMNHLKSAITASKTNLSVAQTDSAVQTYMADNIDLGCMLIEKAATEKSLSAMNESLAQSYALRKKHRENGSNRVFRDISTSLAVSSSVNSRYPAALPDILKPQPVASLRPEQLLVYEAFERSSRNLYQSNVGTNSASGVQPPNQRNPAGMQTSISGKSKNQLLEALVVITTKLDGLVANVLQQQQQITLSMLPADHEIPRHLVAARRTCSSMPPSNDQETNQILGYCQNIFKRLYDLNTNEGIFRLEVLVDLLRQIHEGGISLLKSNLNSWITFAPVETNLQVKVHRRIVILLLRRKLVSLSAVDSYLARSLTSNVNDKAQHEKWLDFAGWSVKTAVMERICTATELPLTIEYFQRLVMIPNSLTSNIGVAVKHLLDELHVNLKDNMGSLSEKAAVPPSVPSKPIASTLSSDLAGATQKALQATNHISKNDPATIREQVTFLLESWLRVYKETSGNEKTMPTIQYLQLLQQHGIGKSEEQTERFFRYSTELVVESCLKSGAKDSNSGNLLGSLNYHVLDVYGKLVMLLIHHMNSGGSIEQISAQRINLLNKILGITMRTLMSNYERVKREAGHHWDQRPWFRLLLNLVQDLGAPSAVMDPIRPSILSVFGSAFHVVQPCVVPGFAFAWLELISHRMFISNLMLVESNKGWALAHQLLIDMLIFLEPHLRSADMTDAIKHLYNGTMRVFLVLVHDFPSFLSGYHLSFCNVIPENCIQLRNLILSASPKGLVMPDPFTPNLKIDHLSEITRSPIILSNVLGPIISIKGDLDLYLESRQPHKFLQTLLPRLTKEGEDDVEIPRVNSLVLYVGMKAIARLQHGFQHLQIAQTPEMEVLQKLMDFDERGRYIVLNAIANQLRYPSSHSHYFSCVMLFLFSETDNEGVKEQVTRVLLERLISHRPHPWALIITFVELLKNQRYRFWSHSFIRCATEIEKVFENVARSCITPPSQPQTQRAVSAGGGTENR